MDFNQDTNQLLLFGGFGGEIITEFLDDTWNWDGINWIQLTPPPPLPPARAGASMVFDPVTGQLILFGGNSNSGFLNDTWNWAIPIPIAGASPPSQTISSGSSTSIFLSANITGTTFSWTVSQSAVAGASSGSGSTIAQTLTTTGSSSGTATYTITPTSPAGCSGSPIVAIVTVQPTEPPTNFHGEIQYNQFLTQEEIIHLLSWNASDDPNVIGYKIFQDNKLIKTMDNRNADKLNLYNRMKNKVYHYEIVAFTASGESQPVTLNL